MNVSKDKASRLFAMAGLIAAAGVAGSAEAATLVSSALDNSQTDITGSGGIFSGASGGDASAEIDGVTTTVISNIGGLNGKMETASQGAKKVTLRAVSAANGMDLTYDITLSPFRYNGSDNATSTRVAGYATVGSSNNNNDRDQTTSSAAGVEYFLVTIDNVVNSGSTTYDLDGAVKLRFNNLSGIAIFSSFAGGVSGTSLGSGGTGTQVSGKSDITMSAASSFAIVGTADDAANIFDNRWEGLAVQFSEVVPEPGSLALLGLGGVLIGARRRRD